MCCVNTRGGRKSLEIARLEHINGDETYCQLCTRVHKVENAYVESFNGRLRDECLERTLVHESRTRSIGHRGVEARVQRRATEKSPRWVTPAEYARRLTDQKVVTMPRKL